MEMLEKYLKEAIRELTGIVLDQEILQKSSNPAFGDLTSTICMQLKDKINLAPYDLAVKIESKLRELIADDGKTLEEVDIKEISVVKPGFINFKVLDNNLVQVVLDAQKDWTDIGKSAVGDGCKIMIEFGQPNTHKQVLIGHLKSAITGWSLVRIHQNAGYQVIKANYFGDVGMQTAKCTWGAKEKGVPVDADNWNPRQKAAFLEDCYVYASKAFSDDEKAMDEIRAINKKIYEGIAKKDYLYDDGDFKLYLRLREWSFEHQKDVWSKIGIEYDREYPESEVVDLAKNIVLSNLDGKGKAVFETDDGAIIFRGKDYSLANWVFVTQEGNLSYSGKDMGLAFKKISEYPDVCKYYITTSVEQKEYFKAVIKAIELIDSSLKGKFEHIPFGWMLQNGKKTSSRKGGATNAYDLIDRAIDQASNKIAENKGYSSKEREEICEKVGVGGLKFLILSHEIHKDINFDPEDMINMEGFSGPYVMYGYSRAISILRSFSTTHNINITGKNFLSKLSSVVTQVTTLDLTERDLLSQLARSNEIASLALNKKSSHFICTYLFDLVKSFNNFYDNCKVNNEEDEIKRVFRVALVILFSKTVKKFMWLLGIDVVDKM